MSSLGIDQSLRCGPPASGFFTLLAARARLDWALAMQMVADWFVAALTVCAVLLAYPSGQVLLRHVVVTVLSSLCLAAFIVVLLANDGVYQDESGPLRIRQVERTVRVGAQATVLVLLVCLMLGAAFPRGAIALSIIAAMFALLFENQLLFRAIPELSNRSSQDDRRTGSLRDAELSASEHATTSHASYEGRRAGASWVYESLKSGGDLVLAIALIVALSPLGLVVVLLIYLDSPGGAIFRQQRVGRGGRLFTMYKFRTMDAATPQYAISPDDRTDPRITRTGRFLRWTNIDEFPQLFNVVKGEMSLVGPRPEMPFLVEQYEAVHRQRLEVIPGMTGLWQLSPARSARIHENPQYDQYYIDHRNFWMDLAILVCTPASFIRGI